MKFVMIVGALILAASCGGQVADEATRIEQQALQARRRDPGPMPLLLPLCTRYVPSADRDKDFETGDEITGWRCLKFQVSEVAYRSGQ